MLVGRVQRYRVTTDPLNTPEERAVLAGQHPLGEVGQLRDPHDLGVGLGVLGRVEHEVEDLVGRDALHDGGPFTSDHGATLDLAALACAPRQSQPQTLRADLHASQADPEPTRPGHRDPHGPRP